MKIFLGYGLLLGVVGAVLGTGWASLITMYINEIEHVLAQVTGQEIFQRRRLLLQRDPDRHSAAERRPGQRRRDRHRGAVQRAAGAAGGDAASRCGRCGMNKLLG